MFCLYCLRSWEIKRTGSRIFYCIKNKMFKVHVSWWIFKSCIKYIYINIYVYINIYIYIYIKNKIYHFNHFKVCSSMALMHLHCCASITTIHSLELFHLPKLSPLNPKSPLSPPSGLWEPLFYFRSLWIWWWILKFFSILIAQTNMGYWYLCVYRNHLF